LIQSERPFVCPVGRRFGLSEALFWGSAGCLMGAVDGAFACFGRWIRGGGGCSRVLEPERVKLYGATSKGIDHRQIVYGVASKGSRELPKGAGELMLKMWSRSSECSRSKRP
jgi:hypothetical protein